MIRWVKIVGAQCNGTHAQHGQRPQEWGPPVKDNIYQDMLNSENILNLSGATNSVIATQRTRRST